MDAGSGSPHPHPRPVTIPQLPVLALGSRYCLDLPCCVDFITLELLGLNYKSQFQLESSCHCPDMWLLGVIVSFLFPISSPPFRVTQASLSKGPFPPRRFYRRCHPLTSGLALPGQSRQRQHYAFPAAEAEMSEEAAPLLQTPSPHCQQGNNFGLASRSTTPNAKVMEITIGNPSHAPS